MSAVRKFLLSLCLPMVLLALVSLNFDSVRDGKGLPLRNPYQFAGQSIVSSPQSSVLYPPAWIMTLTGVLRGVGWLAILHHWLGGWGMAVFITSVLENVYRTTICQ